MTTKTFTSFSGADMIAILNGAVIPEWSGFSYEENLGIEIDEHGNFTEHGRIKGFMEVAVFEKDTSFRKNLKPPYDKDRSPLYNEFHLLLGNEFGEKSVMYFDNIEFTKRTGGSNLDNVTMLERYCFKADDIRLETDEWQFDIKTGKYIKGASNSDKEI